MEQKGKERRGGEERRKRRGEDSRGEERRGGQKERRSEKLESSPRAIRHLKKNLLICLCVIDVSEAHTELSCQTSWCDLTICFCVCVCV